MGPFPRRRSENDEVSEVSSTSQTRPAAVPGAPHTNPAWSAVTVGHGASVVTTRRVEEYSPPATSVSGNPQRRKSSGHSGHHSPHPGNGGHRIEPPPQQS